MCECEGGVRKGEGGWSGIREGGREDEVGYRRGEGGREEEGERQEGREEGRGKEGGEREEGGSPAKGVGADIETNKILTFSNGIRYSGQTFAGGERGRDSRSTCIMTTNT